MGKEPLIRDIPSLKKPLQDLEGLKTIKDAMPLLSPLLNELGVDINQIDTQLAKIEELEPSAKEMASIPDRFNDLFASRGWIMYESMNDEVAKAAIKKAESGDVDGAETDLIAYYNVETVELKLNEMKGVETFRERWPLARKALIDYREERYHACVPVILALLDGMVNELHEIGRGSKKGFFAEGANLEAWDSISAHNRGLKALADIFRKGRKKTTTDKISIPYRNGIMHGMDLGYDNKIVAAKTWGALFAARDWAIKTEQGLLEPAPPKRDMTIKDLAYQIYKNNLKKAQLQAWKPRMLNVDQDVPATGDPEAFEPGTPEQKLAEFFIYWRKRNYGYMAKCVSPSPSLDIKRMAAHVREIYSSKNLKSFEYKMINDNAPAITEIQVELIYDEYDKEVIKNVQFRMINKDADGNPSVYGTSESNWEIYNWDNPKIIHSH
jgi:hypothetical protein